MLGLDMALDADLGIDSIKRVEILSALQERLPQAPTVKPEHLGTLHTLRHIAAFLAGAEPSSGPAKPQAAPSPAPQQVAPIPRSPRAAELERSALRVVPLVAPRAAVPVPAGAEVWLATDDAELAAALE